MTEGTSRLEAFSDGVFAIAITLLILEIRPPDAAVEGSLWRNLLALWPSYVAFTLSFFVILVTWIVHHDLVRLIRATTQSAAFNLLLEAIARGQLCRPDVDDQAITRIRRGFRITFVVYLAATAIALVAPYVALAINVAVRVHLLRIRYHL